jgi:DNA-binding CsgD family transcriptional regulator/PAS domain-containing protein
MPDLPLLLGRPQPDGVEDLADLLFSGLAERPIWNSFLIRIAQRLGASASAFVISSRWCAPGENAVVVPDGQRMEPFARLVEFENFADLGFDCPQILAGHEEALPVTEYAVLRLRLDGGGSIWIICTAPPSGATAFAADWRELLQALLPLLQRIGRLYLMIGDSERRCRIAEYVLETSGVGVILVDSAGSVITINAAAHAIIDHTRVLGIRDGRLHALRQADQQILLGHIREKAEQQSVRGADPGCYAAFALLRDDHPLPVTVMVRPGPPFGPVSAPLRRTATVILRDPARRLRLAAPDLEQLFDLSPAEARLAQLLADGLSMEEAAMQLGVRRNTVRSQLQSVFGKTGTNRQGDLVRLLLSSTATLAQRGGEALATIR